MIYKNHKIFNACLWTHLFLAKIVPEVVLAKEAGISYAAVAMVTDYDCWRGDESESVDVPKVMKQMKINVNNVRKLFIRAIQLIGSDARNWDDIIKANEEIAKNSIIH